MKGNSGFDINILSHQLKKVAEILGDVTKLQGLFARSCGTNNDGAEGKNAKCSSKFFPGFH